MHTSMCFLQSVSYCSADGTFPKRVVLVPIALQSRKRDESLRWLVASQVAYLNALHWFFPLLVNDAVVIDNST